MLESACKYSDAFCTRLVAAKLEIGDPAIALSDVTDRTSFRKLGCIVATLWGRHYSFKFSLPTLFTSLLKIKSVPSCYICMATIVLTAELTVTNDEPI
jgi:hypothetical protein